MIKKSFEELQRPAVRREQKKVLPYTITEIKDIDAWKEARKAKFADDEKKRNARFADVIARLQASMDAGTADNSQSYDIEKSNAWEIMEEGKRCYVPSTPTNLEPVYTTPWYKRLADKIIDFFTKINFGN